MCAFDDLEEYIKGFTGDFEAKKREFIKLLRECKKAAKRKRPLPTLERVREFFDYQSISGEFVYKISPNPRILAGSKAGTVTNGYRYIKIDETCIPAHRLVWFYNYGVWPKNGLDHINNNKLDNRLENLRDASSSVNTFNKGRMRNNTSGIVGVYQVKYGKWHARISVGGTVILLGNYDNVRDAYAARLKAERKYYPGIIRPAA
jgi:hypothetical protein